MKSGEQPRGHFEIESGSSRRIRGFLYSSNPRMSFDPPRFQGVHSRIAYQADMSGLNAGETISGQFTICSDQGEKVLLPDMQRGFHRQFVETESVSRLGRDSNELRI